MLATCVLFICQCLGALGQYQDAGNGYRADITFDDHNDRFDVADIIGEQNRQFHDQPEQYDDFENTRRSNDKMLTNDKMSTLVEALKAAIALDRNRRAQDFAYHDKMEDQGYDIIENEDIDQNYERSLDKFRSQHTRRTDNAFKSVSDFMKLYRKHFNKPNKNTKPSYASMIRKQRNMTRRLQDEELNVSNGDPSFWNFAVPVNMKVSGFIPLT